jgi:magnesium transporter
MLNIATQDNQEFRPWQKGEAPCRDKVCWLDLQQPTPEEMQAAAELTGVSPTLLKTVSDTKTGVSSAGEGDWMLVVTSVPDITPEAIKLQSLGLLVGERHLITLHQSDLPEIKEAGRDWAVKPTETGADLLYYLFDAVLDRLFPLLEEIEATLYEVEEEISFDYPQKQALQNILKTTRLLVVVRKIGSALKESANAVLRRTPPEERQWGYFHEIHDHASRVVDSAEMLREVAGNCMDANQAIVSNQLNSVMKTLTILVAILGVATWIAGIFGMNFHFPWPFDTDYHYRSFWIATFTMLASIMVLFIWFRKLRYME